MKKIYCIIISAILICSVSICSYAENTLGLTSQAAILTEASTGAVLYEHNIHQSLPPASITKIMTMLLVMEAIERGDVKYDTIVTASERAKSMGGSTIFLDTNEQMSMNDLLKGIAVASANDACVSVAEHLCGTVEAFVDRMNIRAKELGMKDTHFVNCNGLDAEGHVSSAYDIAVMSRELLKHTDIFKYTNIWMDSLRDGKFQLANTNKLIRFYKGANGLKTGSTSMAKCCISATAKRDGMQLIAVILAAPTSKERFADASSLLNYGFSNYGAVPFCEKGSEVEEIAVKDGKSNHVVGVAEDASAVIVKKENLKSVKTHINLPENVSAPIKKGQKLGEIVITLDGETIGSTDIVAKNSVDKKGFSDFFKELIFAYIKK